MKVIVKRYADNWSNKQNKVEQMTDLAQVCVWMTKHGYKCFHCFNGKLSGKRYMEFAKDNCNTWYCVIEA